MTKKIISVMLALMMALTLCACGNSESETVTKTNGESSGYVFKNDSSVEIGTPDTKLNPKDVYSKVKYDEKMFYGNHGLGGYYSIAIKIDGDDNAKKLVEDFNNGMTYMANPTDSNQNIAILPTGFSAGFESLSHSLCYSKDYEWARLSYLTENDNIADVMAAYEVDGNKLIITPVLNFNYDEDNKKVTYELSTSTIEYEFSFSGRNLTLSKDGKSVVLKTGCDTDGLDHIYCDNYHTANTPKIDRVESIAFLYDSDGYTYVHFGEEMFSKSHDDSVATLTEDGLFTFTIPFEEGTKTYQFVYFLCGEDGIVLTDGNVNYYYLDTYSSRTKGSLFDSITSEQISTVDDLTDSQIEDIAKTKDELLDDLAEAFENEGINVAVDKNTGELAMDASVLFGGDSAELTNEGKNFLKKFMSAYTKIAFNEKYSNFIDKTIVEGHSAPVSGITYEEALPFSEKRAKAVKDFCLSKDIGVDTSNLNGKMDILGCSNGTPVLNNDGSINYDASRRVSFRFLINLDSVK